MEFTDPLTIAREAFDRGFTPLPLAPRAKRPIIADWTNRRYLQFSQIEEEFSEAASRGGYEDSLNVGLALGGEHGFLFDVDVDHPRAVTLASNLLPPTAMVSGRGDLTRTHFWYRVAPDDPDLAELDSIHALKLPGQRGQTIIELRGRGGQTVAPGSIHPSGDFYRWDGEPWGGSEGPATVPLRKLLASVAMVGLLVTLADRWPGPGQRHGAYLALVGGMLRDADDDGAPRVHPGWDSTIAPMVRILAHMTHDRDGAAARVSETISTTRKKIAGGKRVQGWPTLAGILGEDHVERAREMVALIERLDGQVRRSPSKTTDPSPEIPSKTGLDGPQDDGQGVGDIHTRESYEERAERLAAVPLDERNPLAERVSPWESLDLTPYLLGNLEPTEPEVLIRSDGRALFYKGMTNSLYGAGGSGKTWIALHSAVQEVDAGGRVLMVDFEDGPHGTLSRLRALGVDEGRVMEGAFTYVVPDEPIASMQTDRYGHPAPTPAGALHKQVFGDLVQQVDPTMIIVDGITTLYSIHGLSTNDATASDVVSRWLRKLADYKRTVVLIDHTSKNASPGSDPMGSQHKISMIQGTAVQVYATRKPRPGSVGEALLYIGKDRHGQVLTHSTPDEPSIWGEVKFHSEGPRMRIEIAPSQAGTMVVDLDKPGTVTKPPKTRTPAPKGRPKLDRDKSQQAVLDALASGQASAKALIVATGLGDNTLRGIVRDLLEAGKVRTVRDGRTVRYTLADPS